VRPEVSAIVPLQKLQRLLCGSEMGVYFQGGPEMKDGLRLPVWQFLKQAREIEVEEKGIRH
jgi:hypothetical protein